MGLNIVKKENNSNVFFYDSDTNDLVKTYTGNITSMNWNNSHVRINYTNTFLIIKRSEVNSTQVEPNAAIPFTGSSESLAELLSESFFFEVSQSGGGGGGGGNFDVPQIKGTSINYLPFGNTTFTAGVNQTSTKIKGIPFSVYGNINSTGIVLQVQNTSTATLNLALYKYDYENDIWDIATEQLNINITASGVVSQDFTTPQTLDAGKYCVAFRDNNSTGQLTGFFKNRSQNNFGGNFTSMSLFYNTMITNTLAYSPTLPAQINFPSANFLENNYHEAFQIKF